MNYFLNLRVTPLRKLALKVPVLNYDTASSHGVAKGNISTFVLSLFNGLWPFNKATRFTGGSLLKNVYSVCSVV